MKTGNIVITKTNTIANDCTEIVFEYDLKNETNKSIFVSTNKRQEKESKVITPILYKKIAVNSIKPSQVKGRMSSSIKNKITEISRYKIYFADRLF